MSETVQRAKRKLFDEWMEDEHILVHIDSRHPGVVVPAAQQNNSALTLKLSYRFQGATSADENQIVSFLKFDGDYFECIIPWEALWGMTSAQGVQKVWPESIPPDLLKQAAIERLKEMSVRIFGKGKTGTESAPTPRASTDNEKIEDDDQGEKPKPPSGGAKIIPLRRK